MERVWEILEHFFDRAFLSFNRIGEKVVAATRKKVAIVASGRLNTGFNAVGEKVLTAPLENRAAFK